MTPGCQSSPASTYAGASPARATCASASNRMRCLGVAALAVGRVELGGDRLGALRVLGEHQLEPRVGAVQAPGRVDPRRQAKADRARVERARVDAGDAHQCSQAGLRRARERAQPVADQPAVLAGERDAVGHGGERDEVEVGLRRRRVAAGGLQQRERELVRDAGGAQVGARIAAQRRMDDRRVGQRPVGARLVVVGDDDVHPRGAGRRHLGHRGDRAVGGHEERRSAGGEPLDGRGAQAVSVLGPAGQVPVDVGAERAQRAHEDRRRADPVDVVVAVDRDARAAARVVEDRPHRDVDPGEGRGRMVVARLEPRARRARVAEPAAGEHLRDHEAQPEVALQREHLVDRARWDVEPGGHAARRLGAGSDGIGVLRPRASSDSGRRRRVAGRTPRRKEHASARTGVIARSPVRASRGRLTTASGVNRPRTAGDPATRRKPTACVGFCRTVWSALPFDARGRAPPPAPGRRRSAARPTPARARRPRYSRAAAPARTSRPGR